MIAISHRMGVTLAEVGFLLITFAGVWLVAAQLPALKWKGTRSIVAGVALACAGVLLIIATHWGHFGCLYLMASHVNSRRRQLTATRSTTSSSVQVGLILVDLA